MKPWLLVIAAIGAMLALRALTDDPQRAAIAETIVWIAVWIGLYLGARIVDNLDAIRQHLELIEHHTDDAAERLRITSIR